MAFRNICVRSKVGAAREKLFGVWGSLLKNKIRIGGGQIKAEHRHVGHFIFLNVLFVFYSALRYLEVGSTFEDFYK